MRTTISEKDWEVVLSVFRSCLPRRGGKVRDDRQFLEALHYFFCSQRHVVRSAGPVWQLEFGVEAVFAFEPIRRVRGLFSPNSLQAPGRRIWCRWSTAR